MRVLAVDLGATSARVAAVEFPDSIPPRLEILHRAAHRPVVDRDGTLRWDWQHLVDEVVRGLKIGLERGRADSIGIDTWGVDYGLVRADGSLVAPPVSYRDDRTQGWRAVAERIGPERLYATTGIQLMAINTIFQLAAHDRDELRAASGLLMLPELLAATLTGVHSGEVTSAGTTALIDLTTGGWSAELLDVVGVDTSLMPPIAPPTTCVGSWRGVPVHLVAGHDTASAVVALPGVPAPGAVFVSSGSWLLVGAERAEADISRAAREANFSNEPGAFGGVRFLRNVVGFALLEACRPSWGDVPVAVLGEEAESAPDGGPVVDVNDRRLVAAPDTAAAVAAAAGLGPSAGRAVVARCVVDSLAAGVADVVRDLEDLTGRQVSEVHLLGGGVRLPLFVRLLQEACGVRVRRGPAEATALGNALVQAIALGRYAGLDEARAAVAGR